MLRAASLHEAPNSLNSTTFLVVGLNRKASATPKFKIQDSKFIKKESNVELLSFFDGSDGKFENNENVAIKREQRLLAGYAEHEQRKDCEAGLIMGV